MTGIEERVSTGIDGLDAVLNGGFVPGRAYLARGEPGTGKTIFGYHYLSAGVENDETVLYVNLEESVEDVKANAAAVGFDLDGVEFLSLTPDSEVFTESQSYSVFAADEVEADAFNEAIVERIQQLDPDRIFIDPITQLRYLSGDDYQFRKQVLALQQFLGEQDATVLFTSQATPSNPDDDIQFIADGTLDLERTHETRTVSVPKFRGSATQSGEHTFRITDDGVRVFPELQPGEFEQAFVAESISAGVPELDDLLHGGLERGTVSVLSGPSGAGKTTTGTQFMKEAAERGERSVIYLFEESRATFLKRSEAVNIPVEEMVERGTLAIEEMDPLDLTPQEFASMVREEVEQRDTEIVMIDGIKGYKLALAGDDDTLVRRLHALGRYLKNMGVTVVFVDEVGHVTGDFQPTEVGISYLADNIVFLRHIEVGGELQKVIGVLKKRTSDFERTLRRLQITEHGIEVGEPLTNLRGLLTGTPEFVDDGASNR
ncbi:ATPase domain-containing protein [Halobacterium hubeiense]|uniref:ATPase domain-containing protein n=1 Tax=Halobacterium hubeiense TaxID=1407499 RepID=UPI000B7D0954|nr:ATPase domain-containing protein [Halobacterium hubeiense]